MNGNKFGVSHFGSSSYKECASLLLKVMPSKSQSTVASTTGLIKEAFIDNISITQETRAVGIGMHKRKKGIIGPNDMIVNTGLKKIKLQSDQVDPVVKAELEQGVVKVE